MKRVLVLALSLGALCVPITAMAQSPASGTVNITATVLPTCTIKTLTSAGTLASVDFSTTATAGSPGSAGVGTSAITIGTGTLIGGALSNAANCNVATHIKLTTTNGAATSTSSVSNASTFQNFFDYTATVTFSGVSGILDTSAVGAGGSTTSTSATSGPDAGTMTIAVTSLAPSKQLVAGTYSDVLTIELTAQ